ncbi:MAG: anthranilate synthase component I [Chloroflexi bacterium]|nr:anthranilate synthase component I [Chloroflexota bacterium]
MPALFEQGDLVPVYRVLPADLETPVSAFLKLFREDEAAFLLESVEGGEQVGRYSFIGVKPRKILRPDASAGGDALAEIKAELAHYRPVQLPGLPRFVGGAVGFLGYDIVQQFERLPAQAPDVTHMPEARFMIFDTIVIVDHVMTQIIVLSNAHNTGEPTQAYQDAVKRIDAIIERLRQPMGHIPKATQVRDEPLSSNFSQTEYEDAVRQAKEHIAAGDAFQIVISQRLTRQTSAPPFAIYRALRMLNPAPYMFFFHFPGEVDSTHFNVIGASPEMMVRLEDGVASVRPIAGTRPRGATPEEDAELEASLLTDPKERAEHVMLVDLGRNDLGRVCEYGTVHVPELMVIERYSHVMHIVSHVEGKLKPGLDAYDLIRATFPAGTVSGAPKIRAMEIIDELEPDRRGPYAGAVGYFSFSGAMDTCITIRTLTMVGDRVYIQAGAGLVADSDPTREFEETHHKAAALAEAVALAERGFE